MWDGGASRVSPVVRRAPHRAVRERDRRAHACQRMWESLQELDPTIAAGVDAARHARRRGAARPRGGPAGRRAAGVGRAGWRSLSCRRASRCLGRVTRGRPSRPGHRNGPAVALGTGSRDEALRRRCRGDRAERGGPAGRVLHPRQPERFREEHHLAVDRGVRGADERGDPSRRPRPHRRARRTARGRRGLPGLCAIPASDRPRTSPFRSGLRWRDPEFRLGARDAGAGALHGCGTGSRRSYRAGSSSGWRWRGRWSFRPRSCSWTSRSARSTASCGRLLSEFRRSTGRSAPR